MKTQLQQFFEKNKYYDTRIFNYKGKIALKIEPDMNHNYVLYLIGQRNHNEYAIREELYYFKIERFDGSLIMWFYNANWED